MPEADFYAHDPLKLAVGTQVVVLLPIDAHGGQLSHPRGAVAVVVQALDDASDTYCVRFLDGTQELVRREDLVTLAIHQMGQLGPDAQPVPHAELFERIFYRCVVGSQAYGLDDAQSDVDYRGVYLPSAEAHWSLFGVPPQVECSSTEEHYWELQRFLVLALKANPNVLECLYTPLVEKRTELANQLLAIRSAFLSKMVYQTYNGYAMSQFKKMHTDLRIRGKVKWKHAMHLLRLLLSGIEVLKHGEVPVRVGQHREQLLAVKRGELSWQEIDTWRLSLHTLFDRALAETKLPELPDYKTVNAFLIQARRLALAKELP